MYSQLGYLFQMRFNYAKTICVMRSIMRVNCILANTVLLLAWPFMFNWNRYHSSFRKMYEMPMRQFFYKEERVGFKWQIVQILNLEACGQTPKKTAAKKFWRLRPMILA